MLRQSSSNSNNARIQVYSKDDKVGAKLEEKKKRLKERKEMPEIASPVSELDKARINQSIKNISDEEEVPTGYLDEDSGFSEGSDEETPTGFLDDEEEVNSMPKLKVEKKPDDFEVVATPSVKVEKVDRSTIKESMSQSSGGTKPMRNKARGSSGKSPQQQEESVKKAPVEREPKQGTQVKNQDGLAKRAKNNTVAGKQRRIQPSDDMPPVRDYDYPEEVEKKPKK